MLTVMTPVMTPPPVLIIASGNAGKVREFTGALQAGLGGAPVAVRPLPGPLQVEETGGTFLANACLKAAAAAQRCRALALADDSGLCVSALDGRPGLHSARYGSSDSERIQRLLAELGEGQERQAHFVAALAVARPDGSIALTAEGRCDGEILEQPVGSGGFGYDPVFWVPPLGLSFAQMSPEQKRQHGHRGRALAALVPKLAALLRAAADQG